MKTPKHFSRSGTAGFTLIEVIVSMTIGVLVLAMTLSTFLFGLRSMYKDNQRLASNASLRSFMAQISNETIDASYFYLFPYYTSLDGSVNLATDTSALTQDYNDPLDVNDRWIAHGDCIVLITKTSLYRASDIRQIRIYYRVTTDQATVNAEAPLRYYETADWGEGTSGASNSHPITGLAAELDAINLSSSPTISGSKLLNARSRGRSVPSPYTNYVAGDRYRMFSSASPTQSATNGFIAINVEFINGTTTNSMLSSSSFNYTISPRR
jgi:prepilin-type N-terminal cleavage/methylation domain-containing protein